MRDGNMRGTHKTYKVAVDEHRHTEHDAAD